MGGFKNADGKPVLLRMVKEIQDNKAYLGEVDGLIGDGDHGMNMNKGFTVFETRFKDEDISFTDGLDELGMILLNEIGGSMGPIYGTIFMDMAEAGAELEEISLEDFGGMLTAGLDGLCGIVEAKVGDKTLVDTLSPAAKAVGDGAKAGEDFAGTLDKMKEAARAGRDSTKDMTAKYGRSSRLGERSRGVLDAGATSCCIILEAMADGIKEILNG
ncbi:dihydroxyacetone kinase subunit DhaL [[Clostridium] hylemonae]|uniref:phosphoenolpyruvate--glycerone phosphotransferase n=1 Tax=[Clostridium] hylemonae DSM 15053 TaxID=553973 RepID=C0C253_9FIRM|nr:dihydroxyacetone kinase subunit DhaL [[Clostridium] hylemonae]EEG73707.1 dihydroxyacetone kinase, L subunit [[Clostridium] hylemonae DSM 15053]QEK19095.1 PEP-dependent dihydroxyacetone kinase, ADP-binding subunit DhaL [[Clostridium] hylemonae DSM 15053]